MTTREQAEQLAEELARNFLGEASPYSIADIIEAALCERERATWEVASTLVVSFADSGSSHQRLQAIADALILKAKAKEVGDG